MTIFSKVKDAFGRYVDTIGDVTEHLNLWDREFEQDQELDLHYQDHRNNINNFYGSLQDRGDREQKRASVLRLLAAKADERQQRKVNNSAAVIDPLPPPLSKITAGAIDATEQGTGATADFIENFRKMRASKWMFADKYFHCKANCQAAKRGDIGRATGQFISEGRELTDAVRNPAPKWLWGKELTIEKSMKDIEKDQEANRWGRENAHSHHDCGEICKKYRPDTLPRKWW